MSLAGYGAVLSALALLISGCATTYQPLQVDSKTGLYPTSVEVDPGGIQAFTTTTDPHSFPVVLLLTESNYRPAQFSFMVRDALAQVGITDVYTVDEFRAIAHDQNFAGAETVDANVIGRYSDTVAPVLVVSGTHTYSEHAITLTELSIQDGRTGEVLLRLGHRRQALRSFDTEALYPVLNQLRKWAKASTPGTA